MRYSEKSNCYCQLGKEEENRHRAFDEDLRDSSVGSADKPGWLARALPARFMWLRREPAHLFVGRHHDQASNHVKADCSELPDRGAGDQILSVRSGKGPELLLLNWAGPSCWLDQRSEAKCTHDQRPRGRVLLCPAIHVEQAGGLASVTKVGLFVFRSIARS